MFRVWGKIMKGSRMVQDYVAEDDRSDVNINRRLIDCMDELCREFDLAKPIWLDKNYDELNQFGKTSFRHDNFVEPVSFTEFEIEIIEMDA